MSEISVNINICGRPYPMRVRMEDEPAIREAGKKLNEQVENYRQQFGLEDKQDLLAMVAFDCLIENSKKQNEAISMQPETIKHIQSLTDKIDQVLSSN